MSAAVTAAQLELLAEHAVSLGVNELAITKATEAQFNALAALPGARGSRQPWYSTSDGLWYVLHHCTVAVGGATFVAHRKVPATVADLDAARQLWSVPR